MKSEEPNARTILTVRKTRHAEGIKDEDDQEDGHEEIRRNNKGPWKKFQRFSLNFLSTLNY